MSSATFEPAAISRSRSVASVAAHGSASGVGDGRRPVLGEGFRSPDPLCRHKTARLRDLGLNVKYLSKLPKLPRPVRTLAVFESAIRGLRDHVRLAEGEYLRACEDSDKQGTSSASAGNGNTRQPSPKLMSAEQYKRRMEYLLSKVEDLLEHYTVQKRMREGAVQMSKAYENSTSQNKKAYIANLQCGYKECTQTMCAIEAQLESMLGHFHCRMKGVLGFARVMPGDKFEVTLRLGSQKWKSSGRVGKDNAQHWSDDEKSFKVYAYHCFIIKVFECKLLGRALLGEKRCDGLGLFAAIPQSLTVDVNSSGTIKLNLITHWDPLANFTEQMLYFNPPGRMPSRPISMVAAPVLKHDSRGPVGGSLGHSTSADLIDRDLRLRHTAEGRIPSATKPVGQVGSAVRPDLLPPYEQDTAGEGAEDDEEEEEDDDDDELESADLGGGCRRRRPRHGARRRDNHQQRRASRLCDWPVTVSEALAMLRASLDLHCGRFSENSATILHRLQCVADEMEHILIMRAGDRPPSRASSASQAIEQAFHFLNSEECDDDATAAADSRMHQPERTSVATVQAGSKPATSGAARYDAFAHAATGRAVGTGSDRALGAVVAGAVPAIDTPSSDEGGEFSSSVSPHSTARSVAADSGIESFVHTRLSERSLASATSNCTVADVEARSPVAGSAELDAVVRQHLEHCCILLEELEMSYHLSAKEDQLWHRLEQQTGILECLSRLVKNTAIDPKCTHNLHKVMNDAAPQAKNVFEFWVHHVKEEHPLFMTREQFVLALEKTYAALVRSKFDVQLNRVFAGVVSHIIDSDKIFPPHFRPKLVVTVHQFLTKMEEHELASLEDLVLDVATELYQLENLKSGNDIVVVRCVQSLQDTVPSDDVLAALLSLLATPNPAVSGAAVNYFKSVERSQSSRDTVVSMVAAGLNDPRADVRAGACVALEKLKAHEAYNRLVETSHDDVSKRIQAMARQAALALANNELPVG